MASSSRNEIYDPIRKLLVKKTPEEVVRQRWVQTMTAVLGYPHSLLAVERELSSFLASPDRFCPKRRADIIAFAKSPRGGLFPLILVECKAADLTSRFTRQVIGYNVYVKAPFIAVCNGYTILTGHPDPDTGLYHFEKGLPSYDSLLASRS